MQRPGFTLIELVLVIAIIGAVTAVTVPLYNDYQIRSDLNLATTQSTQGLARAKILAQSGKDGSAWGFYIPSGTLYKGENYATRDPQYDEVYPMPSTIVINGLTEVSYSKGEGKPSNTGESTLTAISGDTTTVEISVQTSGVAMNQTDKITICHNGNNLSVSENAWPAHQNHGDMLGSCPVVSSSSASSVASVVSSVVSSVSSAVSSTVSSASSVVSSAGGGGGGGASSVASSVATCLSRFSVTADGTITTTSTVNITYKVLGAELRYGSNGPEANVYVSYKTGNGNNFTKLFSGNDVDGGETQMVSGVTTGKKLVTQVRGYFKQSGWLTFDNTVTNLNTTNVKILRNGDTAPSIVTANGQKNVATFLKPYINAQNKIVIGQYDLLYLVDLNEVEDSATFDYQDAVLLVSFAQPAGACN